MLSHIVIFTANLASMLMWIAFIVSFAMHGQPNSQLLIIGLLMGMVADIESIRMTLKKNT